MSLIFLSQQKAFDPLVLYTCLPMETVTVGFSGPETRSWQRCDSLFPTSSFADWKECTHVCAHTHKHTHAHSLLSGDCGAWWCHTSYQWWVQQPDPLDSSEYSEITWLAFWEETFSPLSPFSFTFLSFFSFSCFVKQNFLKSKNCFWNESQDNYIYIWRHVHVIHTQRFTPLFYVPDNFETLSFILH